MNIEQVEVKLALDIIYVHGTVNDVEANFQLQEEGLWVAIVEKSLDYRYVISITTYNSLGNETTYNTTLYKPEQFEMVKTDWTPTDYYNFQDINRVESNTKLISDLVVIFKSESNIGDITADRDMKSIEFADSLNRLENNIKTLINELNTPTGVEEPKTYWSYNMPFSFEDANRLEKNLLILYKYVTGNINNFKYCGMFTCGDEGV